METQYLKKLIGLPNDQELRAGDTIFSVSYGEWTITYGVIDASGKTVGAYKVVHTTTKESTGTGSLTWEKIR